MSEYADLMDPSEFVTESAIRTAVLTKYREKHPAKEEAAPDDPLIRTWIDMVSALARKRGRLLTERQYKDRKANRRLCEGDRARVVGESELEPVNGRWLLRPAGQEGRISMVEDDWITFLPDVDRRQRDLADTQDVTVVQLRVRYGTKSYWRLERIAEEEA